MTFPRTNAPRPQVLLLAGLLSLVLSLIPNLSFAAPEQSPLPARDGGHAQHAPLTAFPSHEFQLHPRWHATPELSVHWGLLQPLLFSGFNAALDLRWGPMLVSYSHGQGLDYSAKPDVGLSPSDREAGVTLTSPWTTGGGVGVVLLDEAYVMLDLKRHRYVVALGGDDARYSTTSLGAELGWRYFVWRGFFAQAVLRYWPNVATTLPANRVTLGRFGHRAKDLGMFANVMLGWAFDT